MLLFWIAVVVVVLTVANLIWNKMPLSHEVKYRILKNKVVLITGASSGLGKACCFAFQKYGCRIILCSRKLDELKSVKQQMEESAYQWEYAKKYQTSHLVFKLDLHDTVALGDVVHDIAKSCNEKIDVLINNAGISHRGSVSSTKLEVFDHLMRVNFLGQVAMTKAVLPFMLSHNSGHIVGVGSVQSKVAVPYRAPYAASKHASLAFYDTLRGELSNTRVFVSTVNPGYIKTNLSLNALSGDGTRYGQMDSTTASGMSAEQIAEEIVDVVVKSKSQVIVAPVLHHLVIWIRVIWPGLYFYIMRKRAGH